MFQGAGIILLLMQCQGVQLDTLCYRPSKSTLLNLQQGIVAQEPGVSKLEAEGKEQLAQAFYESGSINNALDNQELTPLIWAARNRKKFSLQWLLSRGAESMAQNQQGRPLLVHAGTQNSPGLVALLAGGRSLYCSRLLQRSIFENKMWARTLQGGRQ